MARHLFEYESVDYGTFLIQQGGTKWIIGWDPAQECEWHGFDPTASEEFNELLTYCCVANPKNLSSEDFTDFPHNGEFNSEEEAKQYIESKFGTIS
jgi:hypothetical protein